jgi:hypothetical protein
MSRQLSPERAKELFSVYGTWFGPPAVRYRNTYIDGRVRVVALKGSLATPSYPVSIRVRNDSEAARILIINEHYERAIEYVPELLRNVKDCAAYCGLDNEHVAPAFATGRGTPMRHHTTARRRRAIERMAILLREAEQSATGTVTATEIRKVLAPWL